MVLTEEDGALTALSWTGDGADDTPLLRATESWLRAYFAGDPAPFDLPWRVTRSGAQARACAAMAAIPFGETRTYGALARDLGLSAQSMGQLCGGNPLPVLIPCHRVLGRNGLGGFSAPGGVETKAMLLRHEGAAGLLL